MNKPLSPALRRTVLGSAFLLATLIAILPDSPAVRAAEPGLARAVLVAQNDAAKAADAAQDAAKDAVKDAARESAAAAAADARRKGADIKVDIDVNPDPDTDAATPPRARHHQGIRVGVGGLDRQYDSFDQFLDRDPGLAIMVLGIVFIVFLTPILITALLIWYKMRKNRMQNETMLKLAERGILPAADAMQAVGNGRVADALAAAATGAPLAEQARALRRQSAWSDLRKGVLMGAVGLALTLYSMFDDGSPNWFGLTLLFVGLGYCILWYFEDRQAAVVPPAPFPTPGSGDKAN